MKPTIYAVIALIATLALMWSAAAVKVDGASPTAKASLEDVKIGMTYDQVQALMGVKPVEVMEAPGKLSGHKSLTARWQCGGVKFVTVRFVDGNVDDIMDNNNHVSALNDGQRG